MNEVGKTGTGRPETVRLTVQVGRADTLRQGVAVKMGTNTQGLEILSNMELGDHSLSGMREIRLKDNAKNVRNCRFLIILDLSTAVTTGFISLFHASPSQRWRDCVRACVCACVYAHVHRCGFSFAVLFKTTELHSPSCRPGVRRPTLALEVSGGSFLPLPSRQWLASLGVACPTHLSALAASPACLCPLFPLLVNPV